MNAPREHTEGYTATCKASLGETSMCLLSWETPTHSPRIAIWPSAPFVTEMTAAEKSASLSLPSCSEEIRTGSGRSFAMSLLMQSSSISAKMSYGGWLDSMGRYSPKAPSSEPTESRRSSGETPSTTTIFSSRPSPRAHDQGPDTWGSEETT